MNSMFQDSVFFGVLISLAAYGLGVLLKVKTGWSLMNPLLISIILVICTLLITGVDYKTYSAGANSISYLLTLHHLLGGAIVSAGGIAQEELSSRDDWHLVGRVGEPLLRAHPRHPLPFRPCRLCYLPA